MTLEKASLREERQNSHVYEFTLVNKVTNVVTDVEKVCEKVLIGRSSTNWVWGHQYWHLLWVKSSLSFNHYQLVILGQLRMFRTSLVKIVISRRQTTDDNGHQHHLIINWKIDDNGRIADIQSVNGTFKSIPCLQWRSACQLHLANNKVSNINY